MVHFWFDGCPPKLLCRIPGQFESHEMKGTLNLILAKSFIKQVIVVDKPGGLTGYLPEQPSVVFVPEFEGKTYGDFVAFAD